MSAGLIGDRDTAQHACDFIDSFPVVQRPYAGTGGVLTGQLADLQLVVGKCCNLWQVGDAEHLPVGTDTMIAEGMLSELRRTCPEDLDIRILPVQAVGKSNEHLDAPGTLTLDVYRDRSLPGPRPALLQIHGGSWTRSWCSPTARRSHGCRARASAAPTCSTSPARPEPAR